MSVSVCAPSRSAEFFPLVLALVAMTAGCRGNVLAKANLTGAGTAEAHFTSKGSPMVLWADTDGTWRGGSDSHFPAHYEIDILENETKVGHVSCNSADASEAICGVTVDEGMQHTGDCELKMRCQLPAIPVGDTVLRVTATPGGDVVSVKKMSVNVRER